MFIKNIFRKFVWHYDKWHTMYSGSFQKDNMMERIFRKNRKRKKKYNVDDKRLVKWE